MKYEHIIYVERSANRNVLRIDRLFEDGSRSFMTEFEIDANSSSESELWDGFDTLAARLGNAICIDCPDLRAIMGID